MSDTRGFLQAILDSLAKDKVKVTPPKSAQKREGESRKKSEDEAYASLEEPKED